MKKIAVITMARNDNFFLRKWISYYGEQFGEENLYAYLDGEDQSFPEYRGAAHINAVKKIQGKVVEAEKIRLLFLSKKSEELLKNYDLVIGCDVDEFLVVDPKIGKSLRAYLSEKNIKTSCSGLGLDVGQMLGVEKDINDSENFLEQRHYAVLSSRYTKPVVISEPVHWGSGFHRVKGHNFHIDENLYLLHFGYADDAMINARFADKDRQTAGWGRHLEKRRRTIRMVCRKKPKDGDVYMPIARFIQTVFRPIYAINKPSMFFFNWVVRIPDRFRSIL